MIQQSFGDDLERGGEYVATVSYGAGRSLVTDRRWYSAGGEVLAVGTLAATVAYAIGVAPGGLA